MRRWLRLALSLLACSDSGPAPYGLADAPEQRFRFAAEAFARVVADRDFAAIERAAQASLDNAATLEALARSARLGQSVDVAAG